MRSGCCGPKLFLLASLLVVQALVPVYGVRSAPGGWLPCVQQYAQALAIDACVNLPQPPYIDFSSISYYSGFAIHIFPLSLGAGI